MKESTPDRTHQQLYQQHKFLIIKDFVPEYFTQFLFEYLNTLYINNLLEKGDAQSPTSLCVYGDPCYDTFLGMTSNNLSRLIGVDLLPTYSYARVYTNGADLAPHIDRDQCEHSLTMFLGGECHDLWPIWMENVQDDTSPHQCVLHPGDAVIYQGNNLSHWRDKFNGTSHCQLFLHFVEKDGKYNDWLYDTRPFLGLPSVTKRNYGP